MDVLILISVVAAMDRGFRGATLSGVRQDAHDRFRFVFEQSSGIRTVLFSLRPTAPWMARPHGAALEPKLAPGAFAAICRRRLDGVRVEEVARSGSGRGVTWKFTGGLALVAELAVHSANLVLLDAGGQIVSTARHPKRSKERLEEGAVYSLPELPVGRLSVVGATASELDRCLAQPISEGADLRTALRSGLFGIGAVASELICGEVTATGRTAGAIVAEHVAALISGDQLPVIESSFDPRDLATCASPEFDSCTLLPWATTDPSKLAQGQYVGADASETAGWYHEAVERLARGREHHIMRLAILSREIRRATQAASRARSDAERFEDPDRYRIWAEALLAGASRARREGTDWVVPDPYDGEGGAMAVPAEGGRGLSDSAQRYFVRHRRARRGLEQARVRADSMDARAERLAKIRSDLENEGPLADPAWADQAMRDAGLAIGLEPRSSGRRSVAGPSRPQLEGVRVLAARDGTNILVGKTGRDNQRLTFKLAGPEDFWFHALGRAGAHVVVRNETGMAKPPSDLLLEAAAVAAWYSGGRNDGNVEVQWTRRKYVRRPRGAAPGTVTLKRSETVIVKPRLPEPSDGSP